jgi:diguanylate cyclase (GGDEF)-like protein/PAS domain S-box-containing protein
MATSTEQDRERNFRDLLQQAHFFAMQLYLQTSSREPPFAGMRPEQYESFIRARELLAQWAYLNEVVPGFESAFKSLLATLRSPRPARSVPSSDIESARQVLHTGAARLRSFSAGNGVGSHSSDPPLGTAGAVPDAHETKARTMSSASESAAVEVAGGEDAPEAHAPAAPAIVGDRNHRPITEARLLSMVNASGDSFWEMDVQRRFVHISDNMCRLMGYPEEELRGRPVLDFMTPEYRAELLRLAAARSTADNPLAHTGPIRHDGEFFRKDGTRLWVETVSVPVFDEGGTHIGYFGITRDMTERKLAEQSLQAANRQLEAQLERINQLHEQLREQAIRDDLTGVYNRRHFVEVADNELERARRHGAPLSLVMLDLDHFKNVNDQHGHAAGDAALKTVGTMLGATTRADDLACRLGGEEFAVLLSGVSHELALERAEKWRALLAGTAIPAAGATLQLTASFGVATLRRRDGSIDELMKVADTRLYRAKALGRNRVVGEGAD